MSGNTLAVVLAPALAKAGEGGDLWTAVSIVPIFNGNKVPASARTTGMWGSFAISDFKSDTYLDPVLETVQLLA